MINKKLFFRLSIAILSIRSCFLDFLILWQVFKIILIKSLSKSSIFCYYIFKQYPDLYWGFRLATYKNHILGL